MYKYGLSNILCICKLLPISGHMRFKKEVEESIGLDIGSHSIKVVSLQKRQEGDLLTAYNIKKITNGAKGAQKFQLVKEALDEIDLHPDTVNLSVSGPDVIARFIELPRMNKEQLNNALTFEAEKYIPFNINEVVLDSIILDNKAADSGQMSVLIAAAKRDLIDNYLHMAEELGFEINIIDVDSFAMFNAFLHGRTSPDKTGNAFVILGHSRTDVMVSIGDKPCFVRQIQIGSKDMVATIERELSIDPEEAEKYFSGEKDDKKEEVAKAVETVLDDMAKEIQLSFGYFENRYGMSIDKLYCSGGLVYREGILDYLNKNTGVNTEKWTPLEGLNVSDTISFDDIETVSSQLAVSIGLALRE